MPKAYIVRDLDGNVLPPGHDTAIEAQLDAEHLTMLADARGYLVRFEAVKNVAG